MTRCSPEASLSPLPTKPAVMRTDRGALTSDAGVLVLRAVDEGLGLTQRLAGCLADRRECWRLSEALLDCYPARHRKRPPLPCLWTRALRVRPPPAVA
jgi:hypothetical protein